MTMRTNLYRTWTAAVLAVLLGSGAAAAEIEVGSNGILQEPAVPQSGSLLLRMQAGYAVATRINTDIRVSVSGPVARTTVRQQFRNDGTEWVEGIYAFPLPEDAAVDRLRIRIGERFIEGEIREKEQAREEYEAAKAAGRRTGLVEQQRANLFTTSLANLAPGATVVIEIEYLETVDYDGGVFRMRIPTTLTPRYIPGAPLPGRRGSGWSADTAEVPDASLITPPVVTQSAEHRLTLQAEIDAGVPLEGVVSRYHPITVTPDGGVYRVELADSQAKLDHDVELTWTPVAAGAPRATLFSETLDGDTHYLLMMLPPTETSAAASRMPRELVFIIDTSGSMHGTSIEQAKRALLLALGDLSPGDRFSVIQFNSVTHALFDGSVGATPGNIRAARDYVSALISNGGTEMLSGLRASLNFPHDEQRLRFVTFMTDGYIGNDAEVIGEGSRLMEIWRGCDCVVLLDAVMRQGQPGRIFHLRACDQSIPSDFFKYSSHAFSVAEAIELSRVLDTMPKMIEIFGIEGDDFGYGDTLSETVASACNDLVDTLAGKLTRDASSALPVATAIHGC